MDKSFAEAFVIDWLDSWNHHDLDRILGHYSADFEMSSPFIIERTGNPTGKLVGKANIAEYWKLGLAATPPLRFELEEFYLGIDTIVIRYNSVGRRRAAEVFQFGDDGLVIRSSANYS